MREVVICAGARTPMAEYVGTPGFGLFKDLSAIDLGTIAARSAIERVSSSEPARSSLLAIKPRAMTTDTCSRRRRHNLSPTH